MTMQSFTISIVSHGHGVLVRNLLGELNAQPSLAGAVVVVTLNIPEPEFNAGDYPNLAITTVLNAVPKGFGANHNAAFTRCATRWYVVLNPDVQLVGAAPFDQLAIFAGGTERLAIAAPTIVSSAGRIEDAVRANLTPVSLVRRALGHSDAVEPREPSRRGRPFYWLTGACMLFDSAAFRALGGFDDTFFLYCEDYEICARFYLNGYALGVDRSVSLIHEPQRDSHRSFRHLRWHVFSLLRAWSSRSFWRVTLGL